jgi:hypothetical protein
MRKTVTSAKWLGPARRDLRFSFAPVTVMRMSKEVYPRRGGSKTRPYLPNKVLCPYGIDIEVEVEVFSGNGVDESYLG